jgi:thiosulfate/3-mercaptopyruvate sulfurtransferase
MLSYDMAFSTLISTAALGMHLGDPAFAIVDCRYKLDDESWGEHEYMNLHIPGAEYAHLGRDLAGPKTGTNGRHPLPDPKTFANTLSKFGITSGVQVVAYDQDNGIYASRLWWMLRWLGHEAAAVLDGGFKKWITEGRPTATGVETRERKRFVGTPRVEMTADAKQVESLVRHADWRLVDARAPERFRGETEPIDRTPGHIPGAANHFYQTNLDDQGIFRSPEELRDDWREVLGTVTPSHIVCYCGSGVTACHNLLALEHAGLKGAKLYPGSWSEWSSDPSRPVERG